jgi:DNA-binding transcriptional MerR regulator
MPQPKRILTQQDLDIIQANTAGEAARLLGVHRATIVKWSKREGISYKPIYNTTTREMWVINKKIRKARKEGLSVKAIMKQVGASAAKIRQLLRLPNKGEIFQHLSVETTEWLEAECPDGMSLHEFIAVLVTDAHREEKE